MNRWVVFSLLLGILGVSGGWYVYAQSQLQLTESQKHDALVELLGREPRVESAVQDTTWRDYQGDYISFSYPAAATVYDRHNKNIEDNPNLIEFWRADSLEPRLSLTVQVWQKAPSTILNEFPAVAWRRSQGSVYTETQTIIGGEKGVVFIRETSDDMGKFEHIGFTEHADKIYAIVATGSDKEILRTLFDQLLASVTLNRL